MTDNANMPDGKYVEFPKNGNPLYVGGPCGTAVILSLRDYNQILEVINQCEIAIQGVTDFVAVTENGEICQADNFTEQREALAAIEAFRKGEKNG